MPHPHPHTPQAQAQAARAPEPGRHTLARLVHPAHATVPHNADVAPFSKTQARAVPMQKKSKGRLKLDDTTKTRGDIPIPPSSRFSCCPFPRTSPHATPLPSTAPKGTEKDRQRNFQAHAPSRALALVSLPPSRCSARRLLPPFLLLLTISSCPYPSVPAVF
ncbi:hypothetical protein B0H13DRAFT_2681540 [Mycena leptocephala]|nr:hypothetical protein B0H13DRAFT_2681540 [Mycena leptocephala]